MTHPSTTLTELSDALAAAVEKAGASTVLVNARRRIPASGVIWSADGAILTSDHVIERDEEITVVLADGRELAATIAGRDPGSDLAVLRVKADGLVAAERSPQGAARVGNFVLAVGRPSPEGPMASFGVISALGGPWRTFRGTEVEGYIRSDTTFYPGFSGGPLVDAAGRVVGINSSRLGRGAGLTIPVAAAARVADDLLNQGRVRRAYLGISSQPARLPAALSAKLNGQESGLLIVQVEPASPAEAAGLGIGDILVGFGGAPVTDTDSLQAALGAKKVGDPVAVAILRGGEPRDLTVTLGERN
ncbi:MAG: signal protein PDZ [Anaerolinea sp.]|nr:signal protein PDZ [Anaerolinea sp.]